MADVTFPAGTQRQEVMRKCTARALEARSAIMQAISSFKELPQPGDLLEREAHERISRLLKRANAEVFEILFCSSLAIDSVEPQVPN